MTTSVPLLNQRDELKVAQKMVVAVEAEIRGLDDVLTTNLLDRDAYLRNFGARQVLCRVLREMQAIYDRELTR